MGTSVKDLLSAANAEVPKISPDAARRMVAEEKAVIVDVRDMPELQSNGKIPGSVHIPRGMLEFRADPDTQYHDPNLVKDRPIILHCASGGRSALSGKTLKDMGYEKVYNLGGFKDWAEAGGEVEKAS
ncbi:rhodanese-like domain-containing protein [Devosia sp. RR2S18]|uniref:rhodanese-like domain-containing protein n=1 Tax=Devosia rhizosphaerae TaxID=3049774 RepID=UPI00254173E2|nr:rhodanese-like domain-containing protein [Devosia sp. RR2S18]WIJ23425.1 rhodanese-like domain-containing protein [Devosia sp. RR2S18]